MNILRIAYSPDENYVGITIVSMLSILENSEDEKFEFIILHSGLSNNALRKFEWIKNYKKCNIRFVKVNREEFKNYPSVNWVTTAAWFRTKIPELCPDCEKVLYLDSDTMVLSSLKELFLTDLKDNYIATVCNAETGYFNSGVILFNCNSWREEQVFNKIKNYVETNGKNVKCADQDVLNVICSSRKLMLPQEYNYCEPYNYFEYKAMKNPKIVHFVGPNPNRFDCLHSMKSKWNEFAVKTPFYHEFISQNIYNMIKMYPKLKFDEFKYSTLAKIGIGKMKVKYELKAYRQQRLINSLKF